MSLLLMRWTMSSSDIGQKSVGSSRFASSSR
jgi:hypothetical protein